MKIIVKLSIFLSLLLIHSVKSSDEEVPLVKTKNGFIRGIKEVSSEGQEFFSYLGIPFAEPPVGELRFKAPVPKSKWSGILMATEDPPLCLQKDLFDAIVEDKSAVQNFGQEDCLYLNVHTAKPSDHTANLPVMVFIHGGGFFCGGASMYGPKALVNDEIVLVVIQYRLGIFGFFSTEDSVLPGNMGLKDQQLALKWVKENIEKFGGNPESITIFGESAGAASVHYQVLSPGSKGLFHRAIMQSGTALSGWAKSKGHKKFAVDIGDKFGCSLEDGTKIYLKCIQEADAHKLLDLSFSTIVFGLNPFLMLPRVDGEFITSPPEILLKKKQYNKVDIITGITRDEGSFILTWFTKNPSLFPKLKNNFNKFGPISLYLNGYAESPQMAEKVYKYYLKDEFDSFSLEDENLVQLFNDVFFGADHDKLINILADDPEISLYMYRVNHMGEYSLTDLVPGFKRKNWVSHADDLYYLFSGELLFNSVLKGDDLEFKKIITSLWRNFAIKGNPTPKGSITKWEKIEGPNELKELSLTLTPKMVDYDFNEKRKLWSSLRTKENILLGVYKTHVGGKTEL